jgi:hypothetical protein
MALEATGIAALTGILQAQIVVTEGAGLGLVMTVALFALARDFTLDALGLAGIGGGIHDRQAATRAVRPVWLVSSR